MTLYFATEARFVKRTGKYYSLGGFSFELWNRYLEHFDKLVVIARVTTDKSIYVDETMLASCNNISFIDLPYYVGFSGYIRSCQSIRKILTDQMNDDGCYICRLPGQIGGEVIRRLQKIGKPYACEVVGDPWDVFAKGSVDHPLRPIIRRISVQRLKYQVKGAQACLYVTQKTLQQMYPVKLGAFSVGVSDVIVNDSIIAQYPKRLNVKSEYTLISVGSLAQMYKAPDIVLKALSILKQRGLNIKLIWLGDGVFKVHMVALAQSLNLDVDFKGNVSASEVHENLKKADIFILVSRTEGLPRAVVEAMAHGLPCIGSQVGGIPELLDKEVLVEKENPEQLAFLIEKMTTDINFTNQQAKRNLEKALFYKEDQLKLLRNSFFDYIKAYNNEKL